ncbi:MAG: rod shape-determining protein [Clostridiales bacterium]|nr:rod shape-determining protein [Clostridiales bacterium]
MCFNFSKYLMRTVAVDLGTVNTLVAMKGRGIVLREPSAAAVSVGNPGETLAFGREAVQLVGRTPGGIHVVYPLRDGVVADYTLAADMLRYFIEQALGHRVGAMGIRLVLCLPLCVTGVERRALAEAAKEAGAREVLLLDEPLAAAIGAGLPVFEPAGSMVVDIGGGTTDAAVIAFGGIAACASIRTGGTHIDAALREHVQKTHGVLIGERMAEDAKLRLGSALPGGADQMEVRGRKLEGGLPASVSLTGMEISHAMAPEIRRIVETAKEALAQTPPELAGDLYTNGIMLTGGGAKIRGLDKLLSHETGMPVLVDEDPLDCVVLGALSMLEREEAFASAAKTLEI